MPIHPPNITPKRHKVPPAFPDLQLLQTFFSSFHSILRCADEHFHKVIVQGVIKLPLETPLELRVVEIAGMQIEIVGVNGNRFVLELDDNFYTISLCSSGEVQERMLIQL